MEAEMPFHEVVRGSMKAIMFECVPMVKPRDGLTTYLSHQGNNLHNVLEQDTETGQVPIL
jgi:hypothetical protein